MRWLLRSKQNIGEVWLPTTACSGRRCAPPLMPIVIPSARKLVCGLLSTVLSSDHYRSTTAGNVNGAGCRGVAGLVSASARDALYRGVGQWGEVRLSLHRRRNRLD